MLRLPTGLVLWSYFIVDLVAAASFTNPIGVDFGTTYNLGQQIDISWQGAENFTALSLGLRQSSTKQIYWIIGSPDGKSTAKGRECYRRRRVFLSLLRFSTVDVLFWRCLAFICQNFLTNLL
jgi:hypothetical protein